MTDFYFLLLHNGKINSTCLKPLSFFYLYILFCIQQLKLQSIKRKEVKNVISLWKPSFEGSVKIKSNIARILNR